VLHVGSFKKVVGYICGVIVSLFTSIFFIFFIVSLFYKTADPYLLIGFLFYLILALIIFGIPFYRIILKPKFFLPISIFQQIVNNPEHSWKESTNEILRNSPELLKTKTLQRIGNQLYEYYLKEYVGALRLTAEEISNLDELISYFKIPTKTIHSIKNKYNKQAIDKLSKIMLEEKILSENNKNTLYQFAAILDLPVTAVDTINRNNALRILKSTKETALKDSKLTNDKENELYELTRNLGLNENDLLGSISEQKRMAYCKLQWEVENRKSPTKESPIMLQENEVDHFTKKIILPTINENDKPKEIKNIPQQLKMFLLFTGTMML
jgi:hypothetical protein